jgi:hypothetical protein
LARTDRKAFRRAKDRFVAALQAKRVHEAGLGIREMTDHPGIFEFRFTARGRATFHYGDPVIESEVHIVWRHIGGHEIYREP